MQCVIMAGGLGTRMGHFTKSIPKALIPVNGHPFIRHQLNNLWANGISRVVISTGYLGEMIAGEVESHAPAGMSVVCVPDGPELLGTGGSLRRLVAMGLLDDLFLYTYGDSFLTVDHSNVANSFDPNEGDALMTVCLIDGGHETGNVIVEGQRVALYRKSASDGRMKWIDYGLSVIKSHAVLTHLPEGKACDIAEMFEVLSLAGRLQAYLSTERYFEIGSVIGLEELEHHLAGPSSLT